MLIIEAFIDDFTKTEESVHDKFCTNDVVLGNTRIILFSNKTPEDLQSLRLIIASLQRVEREIDKSINQ